MAAKSIGTAALSLPKFKEVRGYEVKRQPLGKYLQMFDRLKEFAGDLVKLIEACFPGEDFKQIQAKLTNFDIETLVGVLVGALPVAARMAAALVSDLTGIDEEKLLWDEGIAADGLLEIIAAFLEVNNWFNFIPAVRKLINEARAAIGNFQKPSIGSNA